jgi:tRNA acetyltransferase TAN1
MAESGPVSKRQKKLQVAKERNMTVGQLWRAREKHNKRKNIGTLRGRRCILVVTSRGRERLGTNEAISALELSEDEEEPEEEEEEAGKIVDVQAALAKELEEARAKRTVRYDVGMPCLSAIASNGDPIMLISKLFRAVATDNTARTTHVEKLVPLQKTCYPTLEAITTAAEMLLIPEPLGPDSTPKTFAVVAKIRGKVDESVSRSKLTSAVAALVDQTKHKVNLTEPDIVILVEVIRNIAGVSVVKGEEFRAFKRFNLRSMTSPTSEGEED